jgi:hypothetical protein
MLGNGHPSVTKALRGAGLGMLAAVIAADALAPAITRWRRAAATRAINVADQVAPTEHLLLDVALGLLHMSDRLRAAAPSTALRQP